MRPFQYIEFMLKFRNEFELLQLQKTWTKVTMPDGTKLYFNRSLMENRRSQGI